VFFVLRNRHLLNLSVLPVNRPYRPILARAPQSASRSWYNFGPKASGEVDILIYDEIGLWGVTAQQFATDLAKVDADVINLHINSPGGSVFDGLAIYNALASHDAEIRTSVDSLAASIASVIAMAGDSIKIAEAAQIMVHQPSSFVWGGADDMRKEADVLDSIEEAIVDVYVARTGGKRAEIQQWVKNETWFKGKAAVDAGFADEVIPLKLKEPSKAADRYDLSVYRHPPGDLMLPGGLQPAAQLTERRLERLLRQEGGLSRSESLRAASAALKALHSDDEKALDAFIAKINAATAEINTRK